MPNFDYERKLMKSGFSRICGIDEVGRGPLAGPVVACAVILDLGLIKNLESTDWLAEIRDSKKLSSRQRDKWHKILTECAKVKWAIGIVSEKIIDEINILEATKLAMEKALKNLVRSPRFVQGKAGQTTDMPASTVFQRGEPDFLLIDGNFTLEKFDLNQKAVPQGDEKIISVAAASIIAKVSRDRMMAEYHNQYPAYDFAKHKGYGTKKHIAAIKKFGPCPIHRRSFKPIKNLFRADSM